MVMAGALGLVGLQAALHYSVHFPLSSEYGTCKTTKAGLWPWVSGKSR